jgi:hypothetical protein
MNLPTAYTILAIGNHPHSHEPFIEADRRILKDRSNFDRELAFRVTALALPYPRFAT